MLRSKFQPTAFAGFPRQTVLGNAQRLTPIWLVLIVLLLAACATLPVPEDKTLSYSYDPPPDSRLAVITRELFQDVNDGHSGFFKLFRNDDAMHWRILLVDLAE